jgi:hypothetical protein
MKPIPLEHIPNSCLNLMQVVTTTTTIIIITITTPLEPKNGWGGINTGLTSEIQ